jgi:hypothetical protein
MWPQTALWTGWPVQRPSIPNQVAFALLVNSVAALVRLRVSGAGLPLLDATMVDLVHFQGGALYRFGGRPLINRAIMHIGTHVGRQGAEAAMEIFSDLGN